MTGQIFTFPKRRKRRSRGVGLATCAELRIFPPSRNRRVVEFIAAEMRRQKSVAAAEDVLCRHLEFEESWLERHCGGDVDQLEKALWEFARAAWTIFDRDDDTLGAA